METQNPYFERYKQESPILGQRSASPMSEVIIEGNASNLRSHLMRLKGSDQVPGKYFYPDGNQWRTCTLEILKDKEQQLEKEWQDHVESRVNLGERPPQEWPPHLQDKQERLAAKKLVAMEEITWLQEHVAKAEESKHTREKKPVQPKFWGAGRLRDGILVEFCGWDVSKNDEGVLAIDDPSSPYHTMEIWRLKAQVLNPMSQEFGLRQRKEAKAALAENRPRKAVKYPVPPVWNKETDLIEYEGYSNETIKKLKQEN